MVSKCVDIVRWGRGIECFISYLHFGHFDFTEFAKFPIRYCIASPLADHFSKNEDEHNEGSDCVEDESAAESYDVDFDHTIDPLPLCENIGDDSTSKESKSVDPGF